MARRSTQSDLIFANLCEGRFLFGVYLLLIFAGTLCILTALHALRINPYHHVSTILAVTFVSCTIWLYFNMRAISASGIIFGRVTLEAVSAIAVSVLVFTYVRDYSFDGTHYHLPSIIALLQGWNPFHETTGFILVDHYPNGIWKLEALIADATSRLEMGRVVNVTLALSAYYIFSYFIAFNKSFHLSIGDRLLALLATFNPVVIGQLTTHMLDAIISSLSLSLLLCLLLSKGRSLISAPFIGAIAASALLVNSKMSGLFFAITITGFTLLTQWIQERASSTWLKVNLSKVMVLIFVGAVSTFGIGYRPYLTNLIHHQAILYPSSDIILGRNIPENLAQASQVTKFVHAVFARTGANMPAERSVLKWPGDVAISELRGATGTAQSGGFGPLFGLAFLCSWASFLIISVRRTRAELLESDPLAGATIIIITCVLFPEPSWARYIPILPASICLLLVHLTNRAPRSVTTVLVALLILNLAPFVAKAAWTGYLFNLDLQKSIAEILQTRGSRELKVSVEPKNVVFSLYVQKLLREHGVPVTLEQCHQEDLDVKFYYSDAKLCWRT